MNKVALITGCTGQTGSYLAEFLLSKGYVVHGIIRRCSTFNTDRLDHLYKDSHDADAKLLLHYGDMSDSDSINNILNKAQPDEVYNLAAQSVHRDSIIPILRTREGGVEHVHIEKLWEEQAIGHKEPRIEHVDGIDIEVIDIKQHSNAPYALGYQNGTGAFFQIKQISRHKYRGRLADMRQKCGRILVTPNHSIYNLAAELCKPEDNPELLCTRKLNYRNHNITTNINLQTRIKNAHFQSMVINDGGCLYLRSDTSKRVVADLKNDDLISFLKFVSAYVTEGSATHNTINNGYTIEIYNCDRAWLEHLQECLNGVFIVPSLISICKTKDLINYQDCYKLEFSSELLYRICKHMFGDNASNKRLFDGIFNLPDYLLNIILDHVTFGGGGATKWKHFDTISNILAAQMCFLYSKLGIDYSCTYSDVNYKKYAGKYTIRECAHYQPSKDIKKGQIKWVDYDGYVYDISVENVHNFVIGTGNVVVHNSHVKVSFEIPEYTFDVVGNGVFRILEAIRRLDKKVRYYQASSSVTADTPILVCDRSTGDVNLRRIDSLADHADLDAATIVNGKVVFRPISGFSRHKKDHIYHLRYSGGGYIRVTGDHSIMVFDNDRIVSKRIDELDDTDFLVTYWRCDRPNSVDRVVVPIDTIKHDGIFCPMDDITVTSDLMRLAGCYLAERSCHIDVNTYSVVWTFDIAEHDYCNDIVTIINTYIPGLNCREVEQPERNTRQITVVDKSLVRFLLQFGRSCHLKYFPGWVWRLDEASIRQLFIGYWRGSGRHKKRNGSYIVSSANAMLLENFAYLLRSLGIFARLYTQPPCGTSFGNTITHDLVVDVAGIQWLFDTKVTSGSRTPDCQCLPRSDRWYSVLGSTKILAPRHTIANKVRIGSDLHNDLQILVDGDVGAVKISSLVRECGEFDVYDIEVDDTHSFFGGNQPLLLHNSEMFGSSPPPQNELTLFCPQSPYAIAKVAGYHATRLYREAYGLFACNGILFNHESNPGYSPILVQSSGTIDICEIADLVALDNNDIRRTVGYSTKDMKIWDNGSWSKILTATGYKATKELVRLNSGIGSVELTAGHVLHAASGPTPIDQLDIGDNLVNRELPTYSGTLITDNDWAWVLGFFAGSGCQHDSSLEFFNKDMSLLYRVEGVLRAKYESVRVDWRPHISGFSKHKNNHKIHISGSNELIVWIRDNCYSTSRLKKVPVCIFNSNHDARDHYLMGYCSADCTKSISKVLREFQYYTTKSPILAAGLLLLLHWCEYDTTSNLIRKECDSGRISHYIKGQILSKCDVGKPNQHGVSDHNPSRTGFEITEKFVDEVDGSFYDIETESGTFCAGAGLLPMNNSPRRGETFVTRKITKAIAKITLGLQDKLYLGNLDAKRDWGFAGDYVKSMWAMLQHDKPDDYVIATGETHSVRDFADIAFKIVGLNSTDYIEIDPRYFRPAEVDVLCGDATKARKTLGWEPKTTFKQLIKMMVDHDLQELSKMRR